MSTNPQSPPQTQDFTRRIAITGASGLVGERLVASLVSDAQIAHVVAVDRAAPSTARSAKVTLVVADLALAKLDSHLIGVDTLVHMAFDADASLSDGDSQRVNIDGTRNLLAAATRSGVQHLVLLSSATVYGAWANNAVPLSEDALMRPNSDFRFAVQKAHIELLVDGWLTEGAGRTATILRPTMVTAKNYPGGLSRTMRPGVILRAGIESPSRQYLHLDDLVTATKLAVSARLDGIYNVAPDGWITGEVARSLGGNAPLPKLPGWLASRVSAVEDRLNSNPAVPGMEPLETHPWVVANDRLREAGWVCQFSNEEAIVVGTDPRRWATLTAHGKQQIVTAAGVIGLVSALGILRAVVNRRRLARR